MNKNYASFLFVLLFFNTICCYTDDNQTFITIDEPTEETCLIGQKNHKAMRNWNIGGAIGVATLTFASSKYNIAQLSSHINPWLWQRGAATLPKIGVILVTNAWMHNQQEKVFYEISDMENYYKEEKKKKENDDLGWIANDIVSKKYNARKYYYDDLISPVIPFKYVNKGPRTQDFFKQEVAKKTFLKTLLFAPLKIVCGLTALLCRE